MEFTLTIPYITTDVDKATSANKNSKKTPSKKWRQLKCSHILCWRFVELASRTSGVFSSAGKLFALFSLAAISEL